MHIKRPRILKAIISALLELGILNGSLFFGSFMFILYSENRKVHEEVSILWIVLGVLGYTIFAAYFGYFFTYLVPRHVKRNAVLFYLQRRATDLGIAVSFILMDLIRASNRGDANKRDRSNEELIEICRLVNPYQAFLSHFERHEPYVDFYEYYSFIADSMNRTIEKILFFSDVLTQEQIQLLLEMEKETNSHLSRNIKFPCDMSSADPLVLGIPDAYAYSINKLRSNSMKLLSSVGRPNSIA